MKIKTVRQLKIGSLFIVKALYDEFGYHYSLLQRRAYYSFHRRNYYCPHPLYANIYCLRVNDCLNGDVEVYEIV